MKNRKLLEDRKTEMALELADLFDEFVKDDEDDTTPMEDYMGSIPEELRADVFLKFQSIAEFRYGVPFDNTLAIVEGNA